MSKIGDYFIKDDRDIGRGTFGTVYQAYKDTYPETIYALKKIDLNSLNKKDEEHCKNEVQTMKDLRHPHIVQFRDSFTHQGRYLIIIMEYCQGGSLKNYIQRSQPILEQECLEITKQICSALTYLHERKTMHRDVKTDNIFLTSDKIAKLGDLGLARLLESPTSLTQQCGSPLYRSPEIFEGQAYSEKTDIWSLGCCMYEIATKTSPFTGWTEEELRNNVSKHMVNERTIPYSEDFRRLILRMLQKDPRKRPTIFEVSDMVDSLLRKTLPQDDTDDEDLQAAALPTKMQNLTIAHASMTYPGPSADMLPEKYGRRSSTRERRYKERRDKARHSSVTSTSSDDHGYNSCDTKDSLMTRGGTRIVHIPVEMTQQEVHMMKLSQEVEKTLKSFMEESEWNNLSRLLEDHSSTKHLNENTFLEGVKQILSAETFETIKVFLRMYWSAKEPLLTKSFKLAHSDR